jgi:hypothetical protein
MESIENFLEKAKLFDPKTWAEDLMKENDNNPTKALFSFAEKTGIPQDLMEIIIKSIKLVKRQSPIQTVERIIEMVIDEMSDTKEAICKILKNRTK